jgi:homocysteine S-methyltransferase
MAQAQKPMLLDGSMGQEIVNRGGKSGYGEWSLAALHENPQMVKDIHIDYIKAGADVITTNTYSTTRTRMRYAGIEDRFEELVQLAGQLAQSACDELGADHVKIAASFGPLEASYIKDFRLSFDEMVEQFGELMTLLDPYVDIYLGETFSTIQESRAFLTAAQGRGKTTWVSWTIHDHGETNLRSDETLNDAIQSLEAFSPDAVLINCCTPDSIDSALLTLKNTGLPFGGYANGFTEIPQTWISDAGVDQIISRTDLTPEIYANHALNWINAGANIVGGCCNVGPDHIAQLRKVLDTQ